MVVDEALKHMEADTRYRLWVSGTKSARKMFCHVNIASFVNCKPAIHAAWLTPCMAPTAAWLATQWTVWLHRRFSVSIFSAFRVHRKTLIHLHATITGGGPHRGLVIRVYIYIYIWVYMSKYVCIYEYTCIYEYIYIYICIYACVYIYMYKYVYIYIYICIYVWWVFSTRCCWFLTTCW